MPTRRTEISVQLLSCIAQTVKIQCKCTGSLVQFSSVYFCCSVSLHRH